MNANDLAEPRTAVVRFTRDLRAEASEPRRKTADDAALAFELSSGGPCDGSASNSYTETAGRTREESS